MNERRRFVLPILGAALLAAGISVYFVSRDTAPNRRIAVVPARWIYPDAGGLGRGDESAAESIRARIAKRGAIIVVEWPSIVPFRQRPSTAVDIATKTGATLILSVSVRPSGVASRVTVSLLEPFTGRKRWAEDLYAQDLSSPGGVEALADAVAGDLEMTLGVPSAGR